MLTRNQSNGLMTGDAIRRKFGLRHAPVSVQDRAAALGSAAHCTQSHRIISGGEAVERWNGGAVERWGRFRAGYPAAAEVSERGR